MSRRTRRGLTWLAFAGLLAFFAFAAASCGEDDDGGGSASSIEGLGSDLDDLLSGLQPSNLVVVGARPAMGKCVAFDTPIVDPAETLAASLVPRARTQQPSKPCCFQAAATSSAFGRPSNVS